MRDKHLHLRVRQVLELSRMSPCPRGQVGAVIVDPVRNVILSEGWNGPPRGAKGDLCGGDVCIRNELGIKSGERTEVGCSHAESNALANCAANGISTRGAWLFVSSRCCLACAKLSHHCGIAKVLVIGGTYSTGDGMDYLEANRVEVEYLHY